MIHHPIANSSTIPRPPQEIFCLELEADTLIERIHKKRPFTLSRWGDGEWYCLLGASGQNSDKQPYHPSLSEDLKYVLSDLAYRMRAYKGTDHIDYILGMRFPDQPDLQVGIPNWLKRNDLLSLKWFNAGLIWHDLSVAGRICSLFEAYKTLPLIIVGPPHLQALVRSFLPDLTSFVEVPLVDAWQAVDVIEKDVLALYEIHSRDSQVIVSFSCGITAKPLIDRIHRRTGGTSFLIDAGSVFDPYCGVNTRRYHRHPEFRKVLKDVLGIRC